MGYGWNEDHLAAHNAKRARECAIADGRVGDESIAIIESVVGREIARDKAIGRIPESSVLQTLLEALPLHRLVAWVSRVNTGGTWYGEQYVRFGEPGQSDITGQLVTGIRLEVEAKASDGTVTPKQQAWIDRVNQYGGIAFAARGIDDIVKHLGAF